MSIRGRLAIAGASILVLAAAGLFLGRPPWPGAGDGRKLRVPAVLPLDPAGPRSDGGGEG